MAVSPECRPIVRSALDATGSGNAGPVKRTGGDAAEALPSVFRITQGTENRAAQSASHEPGHVAGVSAKMALARSPTGAGATQEKQNVNVFQHKGGKLGAAWLPGDFQNPFNPFLRLFLNVAEMCPNLHCPACGNAEKSRYCKLGREKMWSSFPAGPCATKN
ncbi:MAG TPA: hypothetical protein VFB02_03080 [Bradyrhizobium sp.]|nr:hypothetical protein [Bradyrhizobium sp.]